MRHYPQPVVVLSAVSAQHSDNAMRALALGAVDVIEKPASPDAVARMGARLVTAVRAAASAKVRTPAPLQPWSEAHRVSAEPARGDGGSEQVIVIGASTGGTRAIEHLFGALPAHAPATLIVQHLPGSFVESFAARLDAGSRLHVRVARDDDVPERVTALVAGGDRHMTLQRSRTGLRVRLLAGARVHHQRPAVDPLFSSAAEAAGAAATGVLPREWAPTVRPGCWTFAARAPSRSRRPKRRASSSGCRAKRFALARRSRWPLCTRPRGCSRLPRHPASASAPALTPLAAVRSSADSR
jgi:two-component system chemotaxis response regulator CheB